MKKKCECAAHSYADCVCGAWDDLSPGHVRALETWLRIQVDELKAALEVMREALENCIRSNEIGSTIDRHGAKAEMTKAEFDAHPQVKRWRAALAAGKEGAK